MDPEAIILAAWLQFVPMLYVSQNQPPMTLEAAIWHNQPVESCIVRKVRNAVGYVFDRFDCYLTTGEEVTIRYKGFNTL